MRLCVAWLGLAWALFGAGSALAQKAEDVERWRGWYREATSSENATSMVENMTKDCGSCEEQAMSLGFLAVAQLMIADETWNPVDKFAQFSAWKPALESAIGRSPDNPDLVFLRLGVQTHVPALLDYSGNKNDDRLVVERALSSGFWSSDATHAAFVRDFITYLKSL